MGQLCLLSSEPAPQLMLRRWWLCEPGPSDHVASDDCTDLGQSWVCSVNLKTLVCGWLVWGFVQAGRQGAFLWEKHNGQG